MEIVMFLAIFFAIALVAVAVTKASGCDEAGDVPCCSRFLSGYRSGVKKIEREYRDYEWHHLGEDPLDLPWQGIAVDAVVKSEKGSLCAYRPMYMRYSHNCHVVEREDGVKEFVEKGWMPVCHAEFNPDTDRVIAWRKRYKSKNESLDTCIL